MDELNEIRNRIKERKGIPDSSNQKNIFVFMLVLSAFFGFYAYKTELFNINNMSKFIKTLPSFILSPFENTKELFEETVEVSSSFPYSALGDNKYICDNNEVISLFNGLVVYVGYEHNVYKIIVSYENNVQIVFGNVKQSYVDLYDRILKDDVIGVYDEYVTMLFKENNEDITFEEVIEKY